MTILDTFFIKFTSDAKSTTKDVSELDKQIAELATKGDKRTEAETKQLTEMRKLRQGTIQDLRDVNKVADVANSTFLDLATNALGAIAAFSTFDALKNAVSGAIDYNTELARQNILTGESAKAIDGVDAAFANTTGKKGEFLQWFSQYSAFLQSIGQDTKNVIPNLKSFADELAALPETAARTRFQQLAAVTGLPQDFYIQLRKGGAALDELQAKMEKSNNINQQGTQDALAFSQAWDQLSKSIAGGFTNIANAIEGPGAKFLGWLNTSLFGPSPVKWVKKPGDLTYSPVKIDDGTPTVTTGEGGIHIDAPDPDGSLLDNPGAASTINRAIGKNPPHTDLDDDPGRRQELMNMLAEGQKQINAADSSSINSVSSTPGGIQNNKSLTIGSLVVQTQASDPKAVADAVNDTLNQHFRVTISNADDSVAR